MEPLFESIPDELKHIKNWVSWREEVRDRKPSRIPVKPRTAGAPGLIRAPFKSASNQSADIGPDQGPQC